MALTYQQAKLVQDTIPALKEHGERISSLFYATMLQEHPELKNYFNTVHQQNGRQPRALTSIILHFASNISHTSELIPRLERICQKHCSLGIQPQHYGIVGEYLIRAFREVLGAAMTTQVQAAWTDAYCVLARMMMGREAQLYNSFDSWQTWRRLKVDRKVAESEDVYSFYLVPVAGDGGSAGSEGYYSGAGRTASSVLHSSKSSKKDKKDKSGKHSNSSSATSSSASLAVKDLPYYLPGQYVSVRLLLPDLMSPYSSGKGAAAGLGAGSKGRRSFYYQARQYTLSDRWRPDYYRISVKRNVGTRHSNAALASASYFHPGVVSNAMIDHLGVGDTLEVSHPTGEFSLNIENPEALFQTSISRGPSTAHSNTSGGSGGSGSSSVPLVFISAGVGASPMMAMLSTLAVTQPRRPMTYVHGSRYSPPVFASQIRDLQRKCPRLRVAYFYSMPDNSPIPSRKSQDTVTSGGSSSHNNNNNNNGNIGRAVSRVSTATTAANNAMPTVSTGSFHSAWSSPSTAAVQPSTALGSHHTGPETLEFDGRIDMHKLIFPTARSDTPMSDGSMTPPTPSHQQQRNQNPDDNLLYIGNGSTEYLVCGPEPFMLDMAIHLVHDIGVSRKRIRYELFSTGEMEEDQQDSRMSYLKTSLKA